MQLGASDIEGLLKEIKNLAIDMKKYSDCENVTQEILITLDEDGDFLITAD